MDDMFPYRSQQRVVDGLTQHKATTAEYFVSLKIVPQYYVLCVYMLLHRHK